MYSYVPNRNVYKYIRRYMYICVYEYIQVEVTKYEDLEEAQTEVKLKQTLWNSQTEWESLQEDWMNVSLGISSK